MLILLLSVENEIEVRNLNNSHNETRNNNCESNLKLGKFENYTANKMLIMFLTFCAYDGLGIYYKIFTIAVSE